MYHKSIDIVNIDLWYSMVVKELKQQCGYSVMVVVVDTCPHLDLDTAHDIPAEALRLLAFCTDGNDHSVLH